MICTCQSITTYKKTDPSEVIEVGDIIMLDPEKATVKRAIIEQPGNIMMNSRFVVGVCVKSTNAGDLPDIIDGGSAKDVERALLDGGTSNIDGYEIIVIEGPTSEQNKRELIKVAYSGEQVVNICGYVDIGDKLCISEHAGKAKSKNYYEKGYFGLRSIGKVIKYTNREDQVRVLLDIE